MPVLSVVSKLLPLILLILLGLLLRRSGVITPGGMDVIKRLIVTAGLPAIMFLSFLGAGIDRSFIFIIAGMFILNVLLFLFGKTAGSRIRPQNKYTPFLFSGFEYGMFALGVFGAAYGKTAIAAIAVMDLGHELFIWFVYVTLLTAASGKRRSTGAAVYSFLTSPIIIAIALGLAGNFAGLQSLFHENPYLIGITTTVNMVGNLTAPLILITIGAGLSFSREGVEFGFRTLALRVPLTLLIYYFFSLILLKVLHLPFVYAAGLYTILIAPPPFIIPLFIPESDALQRGEINGVLTIYTLASLILFFIFFSLHTAVTVPQ